MKVYSRIMLILSLALLPMVTNATEDNHLLIKFGLESPYFYTETKATMHQDASYWPPRKEGEKLYRYFTIRGGKEIYLRHLSQLIRRHNALWESYCNYTNNRTREGFLQFVKQRDPFYAGSLKNIAPVLYFDFIGESNKVYILDEIEVHTIGFSEYRGGGFFDKEAWYDILLKPRTGTYRYDVGKKLRFNGSGRLELRFWSDNYYPNTGYTPRGCYTIEIVFHFLTDGKPLSVGTGIFKIDV
ncbi:MAG: hypothetical protein DRG83_14205 [Deltaproteobacteria bacterium]|nr:MAG: hypothetical protein DRG83_14205 [Deltaproteobacteria bacterium]